MSTTQITVQGWVGSDVSHDIAPSGVAVASFRLGSTPSRLQRDGSWQDGETAWYTVKAWRAVADQLRDSVRKGQPVLVTGRLVVDTWQRPDGTTAVRHVIEAVGLGHDLTKGTAQFTRSRSAAAAEAGEQQDGQRTAEVEHQAA